MQLLSTVNDTAQDSCWDHFVAQHPSAHILQTSAWGTLKSRFGWKAERIGLGTPANHEQEARIQTGTLLLFRTIGWKGIGLTVGYIPKGPLVNWQDQCETQALLTAIEERARQQGAALVTIEPDLPDTAANRAMLWDYGFRPSQQTIQPRSTTLLDISGDEEAILARMKQKWRYNVRLAEKKGISVRPATPEDLPAFNQLMQTTGQRDQFSVHSSDYYNVAYQLFVPNHAVYLLAEYEGEPIASIVVCAVGKTACYLWGASGDKERNRMPNHALQWAGMRWARQRGATLYDFWGIPDELGQVAIGLRNGDGSGTPVDALPLALEAFPNHGLWGVYRFKQGFNGNVVRWVGAWDRPIRTLEYKVYSVGTVARKQLQQRMEQSTINNQQSTINNQRSTINDLAPATSHLPPALQLRPITTPGAWRKVLGGLPNPHVLQSWEWGEIKGQTEWQAERLVYNQGEVAFQFLWRQPIAVLPLRVAYVPKGPVVDWREPRLVETALNQVIAQARQRGCLFVKIDPDVREDSAEGQHLLAVLRKNGWHFSNEQIQFKNTGFSKLDPPETALLDGMKQKWRYNIRLAEKRGITIRQGGVSDLADFYELYAETGQRDGFLIRPFDYYQTTWQTFLNAQGHPDNPAGGALLLAEHPEETKPLAGLFLFKYAQRSWYFYGASSERRRRDMPNYLLQWEAMRWSRSNGCTVYDWWGAPTEIDDLNDGMQGVWQFKQGFGAEFQPHVGAWDYAVWPSLYTAYTKVWPMVLQGLRRLRR